MVVIIVVFVVDDELFTVVAAWQARVSNTHAFVALGILCVVCLALVVIVLPMAWCRKRPIGAAAFEGCDGEGIMDDLDIAISLS